MLHLKKKLEEILKDDPLGLIGEVENKTSTAQTEQERLINKFEEINIFYEQHKRTPQKGDIAEMTLYFRLNDLLQQPKKIKILKPYDRYSLLPSNTKDYAVITLPTQNRVEEPPAEKIIKKKKVSKEITSIDDILNGVDDLGIFDGTENSIFELKHIPKQEERAETDYVARRKPCPDFEDYEPLFLACQADLKSGRRKLIEFKENQIQEGAFFVLKGVLCYVAKLKSIKKIKHSKVDGRTLTIFENGTQSDMLFRSLGKGLFENGWGVSYPDMESEKLLVKNAAGLTEEDTITGYIYIVRSKSKDPKIASIKDLYKIGYSSTPVKERLKNAAKEPTYLMAPVHLLSTFTVANVSPQKLERLLHIFFGKACLEVQLVDADGKAYRPREWFVAPLEVIEQAVRFIINEEITKYRYDVDNRRIVIRFKE